MDIVLLLKENKLIRRTSKGIFGLFFMSMYLGIVFFFVYLLISLIFNNVPNLLIYLGSLLLFIPIIVSIIVICTLWLIDLLVYLKRDSWDWT